MTWGATPGGNSSDVQDQLHGVQQIQAAKYAFAAVLTDQSVVTWGAPHCGGDSSQVQAQMASF